MPPDDFVLMLNDRFLGAEHIDTCVSLRGAAVSFGERPRSQFNRSMQDSCFHHRSGVDRSCSPSLYFARNVIRREWLQLAYFLTYFLKTIPPPSDV